MFNSKGWGSCCQSVLLLLGMGGWLLGDAVQVPGKAGIAAETQTSSAATKQADEAIEQAWNLLQTGDRESWRRAIGQYQIALQVFQNSGQRDRAGEILVSIGTVYYSWLGEYDTALGYYQRALSIYRQRNNRPQEAFVLTHIGNLHAALWRHEKALSHYRRALQLRQEANLPLGIAATLNNMAGVYSQLGETQQALDAYERALAIYRQRFKPGDEAAVLSNLGNEYWSLGDREQALKLYSRAWQLNQLIDDRRAQAGTLLNLGSSYGVMGNQQQAEDFLNQARTLFQELGDRGQLGLTLTALGQLQVSAGMYQQAADLYQQALLLYQKRGELPWRAYTLNLLGQSYSALGNLEQAAQIHQEALQINRTLGNAYDEAATLYELARIEQGQGNLKAALKQMEEAVSRIETLRSKISNTELRTTFFASQQQIYELYIDLLMQLHSDRPNRGYDAKAMRASEQARARSLLELLIESRARIETGVDAHLLAQERQLQAALESLEQERIRLRIADPTAKRLADLQRDRKRLLARAQSLQAQIRTNSPQYAALKYPAPPALKKIQRSLLDEETLLLQYALGEERSYLWAVTANRFASYELPGQAAIAAQANSFRRQLIDGETAQTQLSASARSLSQLLLPPLADESSATLPFKRVLIVADGPLHYIPFAALVHPAAVASQSYTPLINQYEVVHLPSISTLQILRQTAQTWSNSPKSLAIIADPVFAQTDDRLQQGAANNPDKIPIEAQQIDRAANDAGIYWGRLPGTRQEAKTLLALLPPQKRTAFLDFEANKTAIADLEQLQPRIIHFATHGFANTTQPALSGIVLSLVNEQGQWQNGFLRLHDIFNLNLPTDLVVLSACQTGQGELVRGEGLVSLTRGFMYAGAPRVVASLWDVPDRETRMLMTYFYQGMLAQGLRPSAALRAAQLQLLREHDWLPPYYWAAFTLQGEWR